MTNDLANDKWKKGLSNVKHNEYMFNILLVLLSYIHIEINTTANVS